MKTNNDDFKRLEGHPEPKEIQASYDEPAVVTPAPVAEPTVAKEGAGKFAWAAVGALGAAFIVGAVYVLSGWGGHRNPTTHNANMTEVAAVTVAAPSQATSQQTTTDNEAVPQFNTAPDAVYLFPLNGTAITDNAELNRIAQEAIDTDSDVSVVAYTDESGRATYNQQLSEQRAKAVGDYLIAHGVPADHIKTQGNGPTHQFPTNDQDRRAEIRLIS